jgi:hypothetical protein
LFDCRVDPQYALYGMPTFTAREIDSFVLAALEASMLVRPRDHGLTRDELVEAGGRLGLRPGELADAINRQLGQADWATRRLQLQGPQVIGLNADFNDELDPDYRDFASFEFVRQELQTLAAEHGEAAAKLTRDVLIQRGVQRGLERDQLINSRSPWP